MVWPAPSVSASMAIETPAAGPGTTTWKDSNSFLAAAIAAVAVAPAGALVDGRTFWAAGATQIWADAEPAASSSAVMSDFKVGLLGWLLFETAGVPRFGWPTEGACG